MQSIYVGKVPIPDAPETLRDQVEAVVQQLLEREGEGADVPALEAELNRLVYAAYGLTDEEIRLIERELDIDTFTRAADALDDLKALEEDDE